MHPSATVAPRRAQQPQRDTRCPADLGAYRWLLQRLFAGTDSTNPAPPTPPAVRMPRLAIGAASDAA